MGWKMKKRVLCILLALVMALGLVVPAMAAEDGAAYTIPMDTDSLTSYDSRYSVRIYSSVPMAECMVGDVIELRCQLLDAGGKPTAWTNPSIVVGNDDIVALSAYYGLLDINDGFLFKVKGTAEGQTDITVTDSKSGAYATVTLTFGRDPIYRIDQVPDGTVDESLAAGPTQTNFYNISGLYVNGFSQSYDEKTDKYSVSFSAYNSTYMNGAVDIYNAEGRWIASKKINKVTSAHSIKDTFEDGWELSADLLAGKGLSYTLSSSTEETPIKFEVPKGGYFTISHNFVNSPGTYLYNMIDYIVLAASSLTDAAIGVITDTNKITNLTKVMEDKLFDLSDVTDDLVGEMRSYATKALTSAGEYNLSQFAKVSVCSFEEFLNAYNIDLDKIVGAELNIAESAFKKLAGPIGKVLSIMFTGTKYGDYLTQTISLSASGNNPIIKIFATEERYTEAAKSISDTAEMDRAVFQVFQIVFEKIILVTNGTNEQEWQDATYRIRLIPREKETDSEVVSVMLPRPSWFSGKTCIVKRVDIFGNTELESEVGTSFVSFKTDYSSGIIPDGSKKEPEKVLLAVNEYDENGMIGSAVKLEYNEKGLLVRSVHEYYDKGTFSWEFDYLFSYDEAGRLLRRNMYFEEYGYGYDDLVRTYNDKGQLRSEETQSDGEVSEIREYDYDEDGRLSRERETLGSPILRGEVKNEYSYSYHTDDQGNLVGVRKDMTGSGEEEIAAVYNTGGLLVEGCRNEASAGALVRFKYDYLEIPGICVRDEHETFTYESGDGFSSDPRVICFLDSAGRETESLILGASDTVEMIYDEEGYLVEAYDPTEYYGKIELIYGLPADSAGTGLILTQEEAYALAVAGSGFEDGETQTIDGLEFVIQFWDCGRSGYNGRSVYVYQVRRLRKIEGPQMTQLMETVLVDAMTGECTVISPFELLRLYDDPLSDIGAGNESTVSESASSDQETHPTLTVTGDGVNIRSGPGTGYGSIGSVSKGDKLFSKGKSNNWYMVEYGNTTGYIIEDYVTIEHGGFYTAVDSGTLSVNGADVNIRSGPGTEYQSIGSVSSGTTLTITGKSDNWYQVSYNGRTGYIIEDYVIKNK